MCIWIAWGPCLNAGSDSGGLQWGLGFSIADKLPGRTSVSAVGPEHSVSRKDVDLDVNGSIMPHFQQSALLPLSQSTLFTQHLSCAGHCSRHWGLSRELH